MSISAPTSTDNKIVLRNNLFHDLGQGTDKEASNVIVESPYTSLDFYNNVMYQFAGDGVRLSPGASWAPTSVIRILNNTASFDHSFVTAQCLQEPADLRELEHERAAAEQPRPHTTRAQAIPSYVPGTGAAST